MKHLLLSFGLLVSAFAVGNAQKIAKVDYPYQADFKACSVDKEYQADLIVYVTDHEYEARKNENKGIWFFVNSPSSYRADKKVFFTDKEYQADLKVYFTDRAYRAGWRNAQKKHLLY